MLPCPALRAPSRESHQSERGGGSGRRARALPFLVPLSLYRFGGRSLLLPHPACRSLCWPSPSKYTASTVVLPDYLLLSFFLYSGKFRKIFPL